MKLADITDTLPVWTLMSDINDHGDILGVGGSAYFVAEHTFVLKRVDGDARSPNEASYSLSSRQFSPPQRRQCPRKLPLSLT